MRFFTDKTVDNPWLLIKLVDYLKFNLQRDYKEVFIDPGVYDLTKGDRFKWEKALEGDTRHFITEFLKGLPDNHYFSFDYPSDMNEAFKNEFITRTFENAKWYGGDKHYIVTMQFRHKDAYSFREWFERFNELPIESGIFGLGNYCRHFHINDFVKHTLPYFFKNCRHPRVHIYGLALRLIPYADKLAQKYDIQLSVDSTKWTRCVSQELKDRVGKLNCSTDTRQEFFDEYMRVLDKRGVILE
jgi:hypothetical protein